MSRVANNPVVLPSGVEVKLNGQEISVKGSKGALQITIHQAVEVKQEENVLRFAARDGATKSRALAGTTRALVNNMVTGVSTGWERKLQLTGVGYRAQAQGKKLNLTLGFSHPVEYDKVDKIRGLDITITTTAGTDDEGRELLKAFGFPFKK